MYSLPKTDRREARVTVSGVPESHTSNPSSCDRPAPNPPGPPAALRQTPDRPIGPPGPAPPGPPRADPPGGAGWPPAVRRWC
jgi:hypothetical protein